MATKATILAVDDDHVVLNSVERDLRQKYGREYRIVKADSGASALEVVQQLRQREKSIALFVVDQRMPEMNGVQFLEQAIQHLPGCPQGLTHRVRGYRGCDQRHQ